MGQVLLKFDPDFFIARAGISDHEDAELLKRVVFKSIEWARMDRGTLDEKDAMKIFCRKLPLKLHNAAFELCCQWHDPIIPIQGGIGLVKKLKDAGYKIYLLSNASHTQKSYWPKFPGAPLFDGCLISADVGYIKPQPEIYKSLLDKYGLVADECIFIDDSPANCEGAFELGIHPLVFHGDYDEIYRELKTLEINI